MYLLEIYFSCEELTVEYKIYIKIDLQEEEKEIFMIVSGNSIEINITCNRSI